MGEHLEDVATEDAVLVHFTTLTQIGTLLHPCLHQVVSRTIFRNKFLVRSELKHISTNLECIITSNQLKLFSKLAVKVSSIGFVSLLLYWEVGSQLNLKVLCPVIIAAFLGKDVVLDFFILLDEVQH